MSRVAKNPVKLPAGVEVKFAGQQLSVKGAKGTLSLPLKTGVSIEQKGAEIFATILRVASGEKTKSELLGYGDNEFVPWQIGATM